MKNYVTEYDKNEYAYTVFERPTERTVTNYLDNKKARKIAAFLNGGGGFNGWTPDFFLNNIG